MAIGFAWEWMEEPFRKMRNGTRGTHVPPGMGRCGWAVVGLEALLHASLFLISAYCPCAGAAAVPLARACKLRPGGGFLLVRVV